MADQIPVNLIPYTTIFSPNREIGKKKHKDREKWHNYIYNCSHIHKHALEKKKESLEMVSREEKAYGKP